MKFLSQLFKAILDSFNKPVAVVQPAPQPVVVPNKDIITLDIVRSLVIAELTKYLGAKELGTNTDKGGIIDKIILTMGGELGMPWCAATVCYTVLQVCNKLNISYPKGLYKGMSSQALKFETDKQYITKEPNIGVAFVHSNEPADGHGHTGLCTDKLIGNYYPTIEGNSSNKIEQRADRTLVYASVFVDVSKAIYDQYKLEKA